MVAIRMIITCGLQEKYVCLFAVSFNSTIRVTSVIGMLVLRKSYECTSKLEFYFTWLFKRCICACLWVSLV
jgi:hypothetical protein